MMPANSLGHYLHDMGTTRVEPASLQTSRFSVTFIGCGYHWAISQSVGSAKTRSDE
ncbi:hypothetical protein HanHA300_Chr13g0487971 [Helianthus annuus]|nr:hypothetical protein HanHA300_Chr13g0487971 [Helianthus annuus]KAJ0498226.1 hypothetical protein HanHA89_Chr13g0520161 [Helianthus annuus]KAJ0664229.1 hypothetical protein HanLR1_Chr13g0490021 [Helianthus annuus]